jgi:hypothetical protein
VAQREVVQDQEVSDLLLPGGESESSPERGHEFAAALRVVAAHSLSGVMKKHPQNQWQDVRQVSNGPGALGLRLHQVAGAKGVQPPYGTQRVHVDGVRVVQVELVSRRHSAKLRDQRAEEPQGVHGLECLPPRPRARQQRAQGLHHLRAAAGFGQRWCSLQCLVQRPGIHRNAQLVRGVKQAHRRLWLALEEFSFTLHRESPAEDFERAHPALRRERTAGRRPLLLGAGDEGIGRPTKNARGEVVVPHELFDRKPVALAVAEKARH